MGFNYVPGVDTNHPGPFGVHKKMLYVPGVNGPYPAPFGVNKKTEFTPAEVDEVSYVPGVTAMENRGFSGDGDRSFILNWWGDKAPFNYPALLASAWYGMKDSFSYRDKYGIPRENFLLIGDSGGFQALTQGIWMEPVEIIKWQEENCDVAIMFDIPPVDPNAIFKPLGDDEFVKRAAKSLRNYEIMVDNRDLDSKLELLKVVHGHNKKRLSYWWDQVKHVECDGLSFAPKPPDAITTAKVLGFAMEQEEKNVHILLGSGFETVCILAYASRFFDRLTFDSTSFSVKGARLRQYTLPHDLKMKIHFGESQNHDMTRLPCDCPVCSRISMKDVVDARSSRQAGILSLHNLYVFLRYVDYVHALSTDRGVFRDEYLMRKGYNDVITGMNFLDSVADKGFDDAHKIYFEKRSLRG